MSSALRVDPRERYLLDDLRRAMGVPAPANDQRPTTNDPICTMHGLPYVDERGCAECHRIFATSRDAAAARFFPACRNAYREDELALVRDTSLSTPEVARRTGRSIGAIATKRCDLGLHVKGDWKLRKSGSAR